MFLIQDRFGPDPIRCKTKVLSELSAIREDNSAYGLVWVQLSLCMRLRCNRGRGRIGVLALLLLNIGTRWR